MHWGFRTLYLIIILSFVSICAMLSLNDATLVVPHPHFWDRSFVLEPLYELLPTFTYKDMTINERLAQLSE